MQKVLLLFFTTSILISACKIVAPDEVLASYVVIPEVSVEAGILEGTSDDKITEVWVFANDNTVGVFDLPATVPILNSGSTNVQIGAGIKSNGISSTRVPYPFYDVVTVNLDLVPGEMYTVAPVYSYSDGLTFWLEDFEGGTAFETSFGSDTTLAISDDLDLIFEGGRSAFAEIDTEHSFFRAETNEGFELPTGRDIYCELNYKSDNSFAVGLKYLQNGQSQYENALIINNTLNEAGVAQWNKIYVQLGNLVGNAGNTQEFELYVESFLDTGREQSRLWLDNVKIVHF